MENFKNQVIELINAKERESEKYFSWLKYLIGLTSTLLGILVSLRNTNDQSYCQHIAFAATILSMTVSIIFGSILLFVEVKLLREEIKQREKWLTKLANNEHELIEIEVLNHPWYFKSVKVFTISCFYMSLISMTTYALISEFMEI
jgi:hypothetical protein